MAGRFTSRAGRNPFLLILLGLAAVRGAVLIFLIPPFQVPDEPSHYDYALYLSKVDPAAFAGGRIRFATASLGPVITEEARALLDVTTFKAVREAGRTGPAPHRFRWRESLEKAAAYRELDTPETLGRVTEAGSSLNYPPLYYGFLSVFLRAASALGLNILAKLILARFLTFGLFLLSIVFADKALAGLGLRGFAALPALTIFALQPQLAMVSVSIQPDVLALLLITVCFFLALELDRNFRLRKFYLFHVAAGLLLLTKIHLFLPVYVPLAALMAIRLVRKKAVPSHWGRHAAGGALLLFVLGGWWYVRSLFLYGNLTGYIGHDPVLGTFASHLKDWLFVYLPRVFRQFWGRWGWFDYAYPDWVYGFFLALSIFPAYFWGRRVLGLRKHPETGSAGEGPSAGFSLLAVSFAVFAVEMSAIAVILSPQAHGQGRHWLPFLLPIAVYLGGFAMEDGVPGPGARRRTRTIALGLLAVMIILDAAMVVLTWRRYWGSGF